MRRLVALIMVLAFLSSALLSAIGMSCTDSNVYIGFRSYLTRLTSCMIKSPFAGGDFFQLGYWDQFELKLDVLRVIFNELIRAEYVVAFFLAFIPLNWSYIQAKINSGQAKDFYVLSVKLSEISFAYYYKDSGVIVE